MKNLIKYLFIIIVITFTLLACNRSAAIMKPGKLDYRRILKKHYKDRFSTIDNTDDINDNIELIDTINEGIEKYDLPEKSRLLGLLKKGRLKEIETLINDILKTTELDARARSQLYFLEAQLYEIESLIGNNGTIEKMRDDLYKKIADNDPENPDYNEKIGKIMFSNGELENAIKYTQKALLYISENEQGDILFKKQAVRLYIRVGNYYIKESKYKVALEELEKAMIIADRFLPKHYKLHISLNRALAAVYFYNVDYNKALDFAHKAESYLPFLKSPTALPSKTYSTLAIVTEKVKIEDADNYFLKSIKSGIYYYGGEHSEVFNLYTDYAHHNDDLKRYERAIRYYNRGLEIIKKNLPSLEYKLSSQYNYIGLVYDKMSKNESAIEYYKKALELQIEDEQTFSQRTIAILTNMAKSLVELEEYEEGAKYYAMILEIAEEIYPPEHHLRALTYNNLGVYYENILESENAIKFYKQAIDIYKLNNMEESIKIADTYSNLSISLYYLERYNEAFTSVSKAYSIYKNIYGASHEITIEIKSNLESIKEKLDNNN